MWALIKSDVPGYRMAHSLRDLEYLERQGWVKLTPENPESEKPVIKPIPAPAKRGRPPKVKHEHKH
jgi:hypothetical protein